MPFFSAYSNTCTSSDIFRAANLRHMLRIFSSSAKATDAEHPVRAGRSKPHLPAVREPLKVHEHLIRARGEPGSIFDLTLHSSLHVPIGRREGESG